MQRHLKMDKKKVRFIFILPNDCETESQSSNEMQQAFEVCKKKGINVDWHRERESSDLQLNETDFVVFQMFEGEAFDTIKQTESVGIVGPRFLLTCLKRKQILVFPWPVYSAGMMECRITCSTLPKAKKKEIQDKIEYMAGYFTPVWIKDSTHLVTDSVKSEKYILAAEAGVKLLLSSWVDDVWEASQKANIHCDDKQFEKHRCPTFHKLVVCCTGLSLEDRNILEKLITENGGIYREQLHLSSTDILVCVKSGNKYKAAKKHNIKCVTFQWVKDSIENGYAMPDNLHSFKVGTSTPTKEAEDVDPNFCNSNEHNELVDKIELKKVEQIGPFLDGCDIYLAGFGPEQREKLCKVLNFSGATRYDDITERVTHVLVGDASCHDLKLMDSRDSLKNCVLVSIQWLLDCIVKKRPIDEAPYLVTAVTKSTDEPSSPLSKKGLHLLRTKSSVALEKPEVVVPAEPEVDIVQQYLCPNASSQEDTLAKLLEDASIFNTNQSAQNPDQVQGNELEPLKNVSSNSQRVETDNFNASLSSTVVDTSQLTIDPLYQGLRFIIVGFEVEQQKQIKITIEAMAGKVVSKMYKGVPDYAVVPVISSELKQVAAEVVTYLWITECWQENELVNIEYFHRPISIKDGVQPLNNCVVTISTYTNYERHFLKIVITALGGIFQEQFSRITCSITDVVASTHLVSPEANGRKYTAAIKWGVPVVNKDWLLECARTSQLVSESSFLVGEAKCPSRSVSNRSSENETVIDSVSKANTLSTRKLSSPKPSTSHVDTPDTPLGAFIRPNPSPHLRKEIVRFLNKLLDQKYIRRRESTPFSELKRQLWDKICPPKNSEQAHKPDQPNFDVEDEVFSCPSKSNNNANIADNIVNNQLQQLQDMLTSSGGNRTNSRSKRQSIISVASSEVKDSQPNTIGWDDCMDCDDAQKQQKVPVFMLSGIEQEYRDLLIAKLESLGAAVSNLSNYDPLCTHLICPKPLRNEKILACVASGKWILHTSYVEKCSEEGKLVDEEPYEYGNPKSKDNIDMQGNKENEARVLAMHYWRKEIARRNYGPFHDMRAIIVAQKREPIVRILQAGGGMVIEASPPFTEPIHATHCLLEAKSTKNIADYIPLAKQGIYCVNALYISEYLQKTDKDLSLYIVPGLAEFY